MARWLFDNAMTLPLYDENAVWPLGPEVDPWEMMAGSLTWLSNWEFVPHRR